VIQEGLDQQWPDAVTAAIDPFKQGDLIQRPPFFYGACPEYAVWSATRLLAEETAAEGEELEAEEIVDLHPDQRPPFGLITSQTCEIVEERPVPMQPWLQAAPVYRCELDSRLRNSDFIVVLSPPELEGKDWVVDLRAEVLLEKSVLVGRAPIEAFASEADYEQLARVLAQRRGRPALSGIFYEVMTKSMNDIKIASKTSRKRVRGFRDEIYGLRLGIEEGTRLDPAAARLYVLTEGPSSETARTWFEEWWDVANEKAAKVGLNLLPTTWLDTLDLGIPLPLYDKLIPLRSPL
jgi:hypothetical protein